MFENGKKSRWEMITPRLAAQYFEARDANRAFSEVLAKKYAADIRGSRWDDNGETVKFAVGGRLIDGQHRMAAIVETGVTLELLVVRGLAPATILTIDAGKARTYGNHLQILGERNANTIAAAVAMIYAHERGGILRTKVNPSHRALDITRQKHPRVVESAAFILSAPNLRPLRVPPGMATFLHYAFSASDAEMAETFFVGLKTGEMLSSADPVFQLRARLLLNTASRERINQKRMAHYIIKAWNFTRSGRRVKSFCISHNEAFPEIA